MASIYQLPRLTRSKLFSIGSTCYGYVWMLLGFQGLLVGFILFTPTIMTPHMYTSVMTYYDDTITNLVGNNFKGPKIWEERVVLNLKRWQGTEYHMQFTHLHMTSMYCLVQRITVYVRR